MKNFIDPFLYNAPHLDIHGYDRYRATAMIKNFIDNCVRIDSKNIVIVLKESTHEYLKTDKRVLDYKLNNFNIGETIVILK